MPHRAEGSGATAAVDEEDAGPVGPGQREAARRCARGPPAARAMSRRSGRCRPGPGRGAPARRGLGRSSGRAGQPGQASGSISISVSASNTASIAASRMAQERSTSSCSSVSERREASRAGSSRCQQRLLPSHTARADMKRNVPGSVPISAHGARPRGALFMAAAGCSAALASAVGEELVQRNCPTWGQIKMLLLPVLSVSPPRTAILKRPLPAWRVSHNRT